MDFEKKWSARLDALDTYLFGPVDVRLYTTVRVTLVFLCFVNWLDLLTFVDTMFLSEGGFPQDTPLRTRPYSIFSHLSDEAIQWVFWLVPFVMLGLLRGGRAARALVIVLWGFTISYNNYSRLHTTGWDVVLRTMLFILVLCPLGRPLWPREAERAGSPNHAPRYGLLMLRAQVTLIYWATAWHKLPSPQWRDGSHLAYFFASVYSRISGIWVSYYPVTLAVLTYAALLLELLLPVLLFRRSTRKWGFVLGWGLHLGIALTADLALFSLIMMGTYVVFLDDEDLTSIRRALGRWGMFRASQEPQVSHSDQGLPTG